MKTTLALVVTGMLASATAFAATAPAAGSTTPAGATATAAKSTDDCAKHAKKLHGKKREEAMKKCSPASSG